jgi:CRP/FNR family transcriptional regulator
MMKWRQASRISLMSDLDLFSYLPRARTVELPKRSIIYEPSRPADRLYMIVGGRVRISRIAEDGGNILLRVVGPEGLFGEHSLLPIDHGARETAVVLDTARLMSWTCEEIDERIEREPKLGVALCTHFCRENLSLVNRVTHLALYKTGPRVMIGLIELADRVGAPTPEGALRLNGLTHNAVAEYVGTSREIVTSEMNRLRRFGYLNYSRRYIDVFADAITENLRHEGITVRRNIRLSGVRAVA